MTLSASPPAGPADHVREDDLVVVELLQQLLAVDADEDVALRLLRTYADALRRLTQAEADLYESQIEEPLRRAGATEQDLLDTSGMTGAQLPPLFQQTLLAVYRRHRQHVWLDHSIGHLERILYGSTVNIAARLSARAGPGEVLVSRPVADHIPRPGRLEPVGAVELKGVAQPLQVWRWCRS